MTTDMPQIKRYGFNTSGRLITAQDGPYCEHRDVEFARAADKAEIHAYPLDTHNH